ncbi:hypothetical protein ACFVAJ_16370 [Agromyces sp. NPDC057679]|uniref:hypothetical protein n=1 Tax=Agromyces sp. NPDC057679 TaxID=3346207 RepID=UPI00366FD358
MTAPNQVVEVFDAGALDSGDPLRAARGAVNGIILSLGLWGILIGGTAAAVAVFRAVWGP